MKIQVEKLRNTLALLHPVIPKKPTLPVLSNVLVMDGKITASDLETSVAISLPEAHGPFLMNYRAVTDLLKFVPGYEMLTIEPSGKSIKLSWDGGGATYPVAEPQDYPDIALGDLRAEGAISGDILVAALSFALPYCSTEENRPILNGVTVYLGSPVVVAGADGFRMSYHALNASYPVEKTETIIIPAHTVSILEHLWRKAPPPVPQGDSLVSQITAVRKLYLSLRADGKLETNKLEARFGNIQMVCTLIQGSPPDHLMLLGGFKEPIKVSFMGPELYNAVRRLRVIAKDGSGIVRLVWTDTAMTVSAQAVETGESSAEIPVLQGAVPGRIGIDIAYLEEYLAGKEGIVTLGNTNENTPAIFHYGSKPIVVIMPMAVAWDGETPKQEGAGENSAEKPADEAPPGGGAEASTTEIAQEPETTEPEPDNKPKRRVRRKKS